MSRRTNHSKKKTHAPYQRVKLPRSAKRVKPALKLISLTAPWRQPAVDKPVRPRPTLPDLTRAESKIVKRLAQGWQLVIGPGLRLWKNGRLGGKVKWKAVLALLKKGYLDAQARLTQAAKALADHYRATLPKETPEVKPAKRVLTMETNVKKSAAQLLAPAVAKLS